MRTRKTNKIFRKSRSKRGGDNSVTRKFKRLNGALDYGLTAAHIKYNNKDYYGEIYGYWDEKEEHFNVHLSNLLLPVGGGLWKMTNKRSQTFTLNKNNCKLMKLKCIEGQNFIGGHTALGFTYIKIYEYKRKFDDNNIYFIK